MSWFREEKWSWFQRLCLRTLKQGAIPDHVAFIMDGNRRYASKHKIQHIEGHIHGFDKLAQTLQWCLEMGIREVTVYAFSIENFKRSEDEVKALMELAQEKFKDLLLEKQKIEEHGVCVRVLGKLSMLPKELQKLVAEVVLMTQHNNRVFLNICLAYTARHEICSAVDELMEGVSKGLIRSEDIGEDVFASCLFISSEPDLVVRTSGEVRLSDFLLWQSGYSVLAFIRVLWPEFAIWHLFLGILFYQLSCRHAQATKELHRRESEKLQYEIDLANAIAEIDIENHVPSEGRHIEDISESWKEKVLSTYLDSKNRRIEYFLEYVQEKHQRQLEEMKCRCT